MNKTKKDPETKDNPNNPDNSAILTEIEKAKTKLNKISKNSGILISAIAALGMIIAIGYGIILKNIVFGIFTFAIFASLLAFGYFLVKHSTQEEEKIAQQIGKRIKEHHKNKEEERKTSAIEKGIKHTDIKHTSMKHTKKSIKEKRKKHAEKPSYKKYGSSHVTSSDYTPLSSHATISGHKQTNHTPKHSAKHCIHCGKQIPRNAKYCSECGEKQE